MAQKLAGAKPSMKSQSLAWAEKVHVVSTVGNVVVRRHKRALFMRYWIHVLAILATAAITALNLLSVFLMDDQNSNSVVILNAFQFVARIHEALLVGSLILIMMDTIRSKLLSAEGVSLGHFLSPFTFTNFDFLCSGQLWRCIQLKAGTRSVSLLLLFAIPFANVAGPLSAITIVPRLGWSRPGDAAVFPHVFNASASTFFPEVLNTSSLPSICSGGRAGTEPGCPAIGLNQTGFNMDYSTSPGAVCLTIGMQSSCNISVSSSSAAIPITRLLSVDFDMDSTIAYASTPNAIIYRVIGRKFEFGISGNIPMDGIQNIDAQKSEMIEARYSSPTGILKPAVATSCRELSYTSITALTTEASLDLNWTTPTVTWLGDIGGDQGPSFLFTYRLDTAVRGLNETCTGESCYSAVSCDVNARWSPHGLWYNTGQPGLLYQNDPQPRAIFNQHRTRTSPILIQKDWLDLITVPGAPTMAETMSNLLNNWNVPRTGKASSGALNPVQGNIGPTNRSVAIAIILATTLTESLAQQPANLGASLYNGNCSDTRPGFTFPSEVCAQTPAHWIKSEQLGADLDLSNSMITFSVRRNGYGWFLRDSIVVKVALGILLFHALATAVYLLCVLIGKRIITTRWPSATELIILAIDSFRAPELIGSTVCVTDSDVWRKRVTLREVDYGDRLSLIVGNPQLYPERVGGVPQVGKKYQ